MKRIILYFFLNAAAINAQTGGESFAFMRYPSSARVMALGGYNVALVEPDAALAFQNPGLLGPESDRSLSLGYMSFFGSIHTGSAIFAKALGEKGAWAAGANFSGYGSFRQTGPDNSDQGEFSAGDAALSLTYARSLSDRWRGGIAFKVLYSSIESYSSIGIAADAGLSYYDSEREQSFGIAISNAGAQIKTYAETRYGLPFDVRAGFTRRVAHAPFRISLTAMYLTRWNIPAIDHFVAGIDFIPSDNLWIGVGYNPRVAREMKLETGNTFGGFSAGAGIRIRTFNVGVGVAGYHPSATSLMVSVGVQL
jgi:hypothetical protein